MAGTIKPISLQSSHRKLFKSLNSGLRISQDVLDRMDWSVQIFLGGLGIEATDLMDSVGRSTLMVDDVAAALKVRNPADAIARAEKAAKAWPEVKHTGFYSAWRLNEQLRKHTNAPRLSGAVGVFMAHFLEEMFTRSLKNAIMRTRRLGRSTVMADTAPIGFRTDLPEEEWEE